jgi:transcription elongation factor SPT6
MIDIVNDVGVDINRALSSTSAASPLQFVCGLGIRKATSLLAKIRGKTVFLESRADLIREIQMGKVIFINSASFLRIQQAYMGKRRYPADVLDNTRIHPEDYSTARKIACDAMDMEEDEENPSKPVEDIMKSPEPLDMLDLESFARHLRDNGGQEKLYTLRMIRSELRSPYRDTRQPFEPATVNQVFTMLSGENDRTLRKGMLVGVRVTRVKDRIVSVQLDSGLDGIIGLKNLSDRTIRSPSEVVQPGQVLRCCILDVYKDKFLVELDAREAQERGEGSRRRDEYFDRAAEAADTNQTIGKYFFHNVHSYFHEFIFC